MTYSKFLDVDLIMVIVFLVATLLIGMKHGKSVKNIQDYALGGRNFSDKVLISTLVATWISGSAFFTIISKIYAEGFSFLFACSGMFLSFLISAFFIIPKMSRFLGSTSVAELMGNIYGDYVRVISVIAGTIGSIGIIAIQFRAFGNIVSYFYELPISVSVIIAGIIVTLYSSFGGIKSVTFTDVLQFAVFVFAIPFITISIWEQLNDLYGFSIMNVFKMPKYDMLKIFNFDDMKFWDMFFIFLYFSIPGLDAAICQRIFMGKNVKQVKSTFIVSGFIVLAVIIILSFIPLLINGINPNLSQSEVLGFIIDNYTYVGLKGVIITGVLAMAMSTADSSINASSVLFANDLCPQIGINKISKLLISKIVSFILGIVSIILAISSSDLLSIIIAANCFYMPVVTVPLICTILGFKTSSRCVLIGMFAGVSTVIIWKLLGIEMEVIIIAMAVNLAFLIGSHYILRESGGWEFENFKEKKSISHREVSKDPFSVKTLYKDFLVYCRKNSPTNDLMYVVFGCYCIIFTLITLYSVDVALLSKYKFIKSTLQSMAVISFFVATYPMWPTVIKQETKKVAISVLWYFTSFSVLAVLNTFFMLINKVEVLSLSLFSINVIVFLLFLEWKVAIPMIVSGLFFGVQLYKISFDINNLDFNIGSQQFVFMYFLILLSVVVLIFIRPIKNQQMNIGKVNDILDKELDNYTDMIKQQENEMIRLDAISRRILRNIIHELRIPLGRVINFAEIIKDIISSAGHKELDDLSKNMSHNSNHLSNLTLNILDIVTMRIDSINLDKVKLNLGEIVEERVEFCKNIYLDNKRIKFDIDLEKNINTLADKDYIRQVIDTLLVNAINYSEEGTIYVSLKLHKYGIEFYVKDQGIKIPDREIYDIFGVSLPNSDLSQRGRSTGLIFCKNVIESHNGYLYVESDSHTTFKFILPIT